MELINIQEELAAQIKKLKTNFKKSPKERITSIFVDTRLQNLEAKFKEFTKNHYEAVKKRSSLKSNYFEDDVFSEIEEFYIEFKTELMELLTNFPGKDTHGKSTELNSGSSKASVKLPKIIIPKFSGNYSEWISFRDLFTSLIHKSKDIDDVQKLQYLKGYLTGEAEQLLRHIPISSNSYEQCWTMLNHRYNNKQYLVNCILQRFFNLKLVCVESASCIKMFLDNINDMLNGLTNLNISTKSWDVLIIYIISQKLDLESRKNWEVKVSSITNNSEVLPSIKDFQDFLETRYHSLEFLDGRLNKSKCSNSNSNSNRVNLHVSSSQQNRQLSCSYCDSAQHKIMYCKQFKDITVNDKRNFVQTKGLCFNCLSSHHVAKHCRSATSCQICKRRHHTILHQSVTEAAVEEATAEIGGKGDMPIEEQGLDVGGSYFSKGLGRSSLIGTALVNAESRSGTGSITLRALIDPGSHVSFITEAAAQLLGLSRTTVRENFAGLGGKSTLTAKSMTEVTLRSSLNPDCPVRMKEVFILEKLTALLPPREVKLQSWPFLDQIKLADPEFYRPNKIDILIGTDGYRHILRDGVKRCPSGSIVAQETIFGWILSGKYETQGYPKNDSSGLVCMHVQMDDLLKSFWEMEHEPSVTKRMFTEDEQLCEQFYASSTKRDASGRYVVKLPFKENGRPSCLDGNSRDIALKQFKALERRLEHKSHLKAEYHKTFKEYLELNHMRPLTGLDKPTGVYLPYHAVVREDKTTTKVRVVFNASSRGTNGISLNDNLLVGPTLQPELRHTIMRWRTHPICLTADIVKMYRQILVDEEDTDFQRIVWRESPEEEIGEYKLLRVTFGTSSAPYLAVRTLIRLADDEGESYPLAAASLKKDMYIDDYLSGCQNIEQAKDIYRQMNQLLGKAGFTLQKWYSNNKEVMSMMKEASSESTEEKDEGKEMEDKPKIKNKILGLTWNREHDEFEYAVQLFPMTAPVTKRKVIADIARLYDPLGWVAPVIISAKILIQKLWLAGIEWDEGVPQALLDEWTAYRNNLEKLTQFRLPRWVKSSGTDQVVELHGFCDASNAAFGAVVYLRIIDAAGNVHVNLITAKTRVAPIKQISIPRLELNGAVLLAKVLIEVAQVLDISTSQLYAWTDSEVVLAWLSSHPSRWKTFIANRVSEIISLLDRGQWHYIRSQQNPADVASRGIKPADIINHRLWLHGPEELREKNVQYSQAKKTNITLEERKSLVHVATLDGNDDDIWWKFSSLPRLLRVVAYCRRFLRKKYNTENSRSILKQEIEDALKVMIKKSQQRYFKEEITDLSRGIEINKRSKLKSFTPFLDDQGILRVGGQIQRARVERDQKHPIIIPHDSPLAKLLVSDVHNRTLHGGPQLMLNILQMKYWVIGGKNLVKQHYRQCVRCVRYANSNKTKLMGQLPEPRVTPKRAFLFSGVDFAGPINMRTTKGRGHKSYKGYICLFICLSTKAIHLEAVSDLSSQGFLSAFRRFVARRGHCSDLYSDNGTNFVGAARDLNDLFRLERSKILPEILDWLSTNGTQWHFIPPHAPNFGGLWEAGIKSTKYHLRRVIGASTLTFEEMATLLAQIEACLNSRPVSYVVDHAETSPLTPGHFLVGESLILPPDRSYEQTTISSLRRWQLCQRMLQGFWRRWADEYLVGLMRRQKWTCSTSPELQIGDVVLIKEPDLPPSRWLMGVIVEKHPGVDKITRVVTLRCKDSLLKRPVSKLCILPLAE